MALVFYVDVILLVGSTDYLFDSLISALNFEFGMKDFGQLSYFLGIEAILNSTSDKLMLTQNKYYL